jgi:hypothetical protein
MHPDEAAPAAEDDEAARLLQEQLDPVALPPGQRDALLRRILERTGGQLPLPPVPPPPTD